MGKIFERKEKKNLQPGLISKMLFTSASLLSRFFGCEHVRAEGVGGGRKIVGSRCRYTDSCEDKSTLANTQVLTINADLLSVVARFDAAVFVHTIQKLKDEAEVTGSVFLHYRDAPCASVIHSSVEGRYAISPTHASRRSRATLTNSFSGGC